MTNRKLEGLFKGSKLLAIMLVIISAEYAIAKFGIENNAKLQLEIEDYNLRQQVFVLPNSQTETYKPARKQTMLVSFVENIANSFLTYSPKTVKKQFEEIDRYMSSSMLARFNHFFYKEVSRFSNYNSSIFQLDKTMTEVIEQEARTDRKTGVELKNYIVTVKGKRRFIIGRNSGRALTKEKYDSIRFSIQEVPVSKANPYGFVLTKFDLTKIKYNSKNNK